MVTTPAELLRLMTFLMFLLLGIAVARERGSRRRRLINRFLVYVMGVSAFAGFSQIDDWPFSQYTLAAYLAQTSRAVCQTDFVGADARGAEFPVDPMAWSPVYSSALQYWFEMRYKSLSRPQQDEIMRFLLTKAEASRQRARQGKWLGFERHLGPMACGYWWLLPRATRFGPTPYVALRAYQSCCVPDELLRDPAARHRALVAEWPR